MQTKRITAHDTAGRMDQINMTTAVWLGVKGFCASNGPLCRWPVNTVLPAHLAKDRFSLAGQAVAAAVMAVI